MALSPFVAVLPVLPVMLVLGYLLQRTLLGRSLRAGRLVPLLTTFGLAIVIQNALLQIFSPDVRSLGATAGSVVTASWRISGSLAIPVLGLLVLAVAVAVAVLGGLHLFLRYTPMGREMRATARDPDTAQPVGINAKAVYARRPRSPSRQQRSPGCSSRCGRGGLGVTFAMEEFTEIRWITLASRPRSFPF